MARPVDRPRDSADDGAPAINIVPDAPKGALELGAGSVLICIWRNERAYVGRHADVIREDA